MSESWSRYAPSPTGPLHLGNLQTALAAWLQARLQGAGFILRIEDIDAGRCRPEFTQRIVSDLRQLGFDWDIGPGATPEPTYLQSLRYDLYHAALDRLAEAGHLFPCRCTRRDLREIGRAPHGPLGQVYPGTCRPGIPDERFQWRQALSTGWSLRFQCTQTLGEFHDRLAGRIQCEVQKTVGDFVVLRRDGMIAYHLAVAVDDIEMDVSNVVRGYDLIWSVFPQRLIYDALGASSPEYWHVPLRLDEGGRRMAKRSGGVTLQRSLEAGFSAESIIGQLAHGLGLIDREQAISLPELLSGLDEPGFVRSLRSAARGVGGIGQDA